MIKTVIGMVIGGAIGAAVGYMTYCRGGGCPLTGNPIGGLIFGAVIGGLLASQLAGPVKYTPSEHFVEVQTEEELKTLLSGGGVVLVDFYANWCGPCRRLKPALHELADEFAGKAVIAGVNVDKLGGLAREYGVRGIPDVRLFADGENLEKFVGLQRKQTIERAISMALATKEESQDE